MGLLLDYVKFEGNRTQLDLPSFAPIRAPSLEMVLLLDYVKFEGNRTQLDLVICSNTIATREMGLLLDYIKFEGNRTQLDIPSSVQITPPASLQLLLRVVLLFCYW